MASIPSVKPAVCIPAEQALVISRALRRFELLKPAYASKVKANAAWRAAHAQDSIALAGSAKTVQWWEEAYTEEGKLRQNAERTSAGYKGKARRRGLLVALEAVGLALLTYVIITK